LHPRGQALAVLSSSFCCREPVVLARHLRPHNAVRSAAVLPIDLARQVFVIYSLGFGIWRGNNDKDAAKAAYRGGPPARAEIVVPASVARKLRLFEP
jgi:hypothetical protein